MKLAAIDLGTNSFHAVIVEVTPSGRFEVIDREKDMVRLGASSLVSGRLSAAAARRGLAALRKYRRIVANHRVERTIAVATSAIREAANGTAFLERVARETGFRPRIISGEEEGRLVHLAALHSVHLPGRALVVDVGGGSVEMVLGSGSRVERIVSAKLGCLRLTERFVRSDPLSPADEARLAGHVVQRLGEPAAGMRRLGFDRLVGTSGTALAIGALALHEMGRRPREPLHHQVVSREAVHRVRRLLVECDLRQRRRLPGLDPERADIVVAGAVVLDEIMAHTGASELLLCEWALREGVLLDHIHGRPRPLAAAEPHPDVRRRSVLHLGERCQFDAVHARHVTGLSLQLFDGLAGRRRLGPQARGLLEWAALLHDVGRHLSYPRHHKHTYYLVKNGGLCGFSPEEIETIALVARYHRGSRPRRHHRGYGELPRRQRRTVRLLSAMLRLAEALDRSHRQRVRSLQVTERAGRLSLSCEVRGDAELEREGALRHLGLLGRELGRPLALTMAAPAARRAA
ncbi:MAG TPA: Ppx/GppA phosphatase family protein [Vicinamibacteria bacterium]|nr:Ppx/GppA phosphatase family protein [Vicinamibacteria bacterium]